MYRQEPGSCPIFNDHLEHEWSTRWYLPLNASKCGHLCVRNDPPEPLSICPSGPAIPSITSTKDLGVVVAASFKPSSNCAAATKRARVAHFPIKRSFTHLTPNIFRPLYCALVRPHLEYAIQAAAPYLKKDIDYIEKVQRLATRVVVGLREETYERRLAILNLQSLEDRKLRGDSILAFSFMTGRFDLPLEEFFPLSFFRIRIRIRIFNGLEKGTYAPNNHEQACVQREETKD